MTAEELLAMPDDGTHRYELVKGELIEMSPTGELHSRIAARIHVHLGSYVREHKLGETYVAEGGFWLFRNPDTVRAPDVAFVRAERLVKGDTFIQGPPDLAVEVLSPNDLFSEVHAKLLEYLRSGTRMVVVVDPRKEIAMVRTPNSATDLTIDDTLTGGDVIPGWTLPLRELFE